MPNNQPELTPEECEEINRQRFQEMKEEVHRLVATDDPEFKTMLANIDELFRLVKEQGLWKEDES